MQTLLLTVASAIILAIASAFAAPFLVDFTQWRAAFETQASRAIGAPVSIRGPIRAELLPLPRLVLRDVSIGAEAAGTGLAVAELRGSFALGPLMRGEIVAEELTLVKPRLRLVVDTEGRPVAPPGGARPAANFQVADLRIENGVVELEDRGSGSLFRLDDVDLKGEIGGPDGPFKLDGEVAGDLGGTRKRETVRLTFGPLEPAAGGEAVTGRLRLVVQGVGAAAPRGIEIDGLARFAAGVPSFEGRATIGARADAASASPLAKAGWSLTGRLRADRAALRFEQLALTLGAAQRPVELTGSGQLALGAAPRLDLTLAARQVDLNAATAGSAPLAALSEAGQALGPLAGLAPQGALSLSADTLLLGGATLRELKVGLGWSPAGWQVTALEAKLPGRAALHAAGTLPGLGTPNSGDPAFAGTLRFEAEDPAAFAAWAAPGTPGLLEGLPPGALRLTAAVNADGGGVALSGLDLAVGPARFTGEVSLRTANGGRARLDATLAARVLDLDPVLPAARRLLAAAGADLDAGLRFSGRGLRLAGLTADRLDLAASSAPDGISIERI
ncbi:MAG TPA: AsmA family protein, partial [Xanthobacteraceae bacterium]|nr:AsmA family protein [Xanthobacteraceae bacterium]